MTLLLCSIRPEGAEKPNCFRYLSVLASQLCNLQALYRITSPERTVLFQASTANELDEWLKFISNAITSNHSGGGGGGGSGSTRTEPKLTGSSADSNGACVAALDAIVFFPPPPRPLPSSASSLCARMYVTLTLVSSRNRQCWSCESSSQWERTSHGGPARGAPIERTQHLLIAR